MRQFNHIFFDLDRTLWGFDSNSKETFAELYDKYHLRKNGIDDFEKFFAGYQKINHSLWDEYRKGLIEKDFLNVQRFYLTLLSYRIDDRRMAAEMARDYVTVSPTKKRLFPYATDILDYLKNKGYNLHIITNGFPEVQRIKMKNSGFDPYFQEVIISEETGYKKPAREIFDIAMQKAGAEAGESVMIGDDIEVDIQGGANAGMTTVWVNYHDEKAEFKPDFEVKNLKQIEEIL